MADVQERTSNVTESAASQQERVAAPVHKAESGVQRSRYIPRAVRREVFARDDGRCTFVSPDGRRCGAPGFLEFHHHDVTFADGGEASVDNLRLACRAHNNFMAVQDYGQTFMDGKHRDARACSRQDASSASEPSATG